MSSTTTYVVYHITYSGNKLPSKFNSLITPSNYIGSTSIEQINKGYRGSVCSKKYKVLWELELNDNPNLFKLEIISYHDTRSDATWKELQIQRIFNVVKNPLFVNQAYASINGCFGMDQIGQTKSDEQKLAQSIRQTGKKRGPNKNPTKKYNKSPMTDETKEKISASSKGKKREPYKTNSNKGKKRGPNKNLSKTYDKPTQPSNKPFLSMIHNKKTYAKAHISIHFKDLKQYY